MSSPGYKSYPMGERLDLEPSLDEEDYIHETSDDFDEEAEIERGLNREEDKFEDELRHCDESF